MRALICGVGGQDGSYLSSLLLDAGYEVVGTSRDAATSSFTGLSRLQIRDRVRTVSMVSTDFRSVLSTLKTHRPDEIYNLSGQSSVGLSFEQPVETIESIVIGTLNLLEAIRFLELPVRFYNASSGECFGDTNGAVADENTPFRPRSPYAVAKASAHELVVNYREAYGLFACNGILFNHESPLRPARFVTQKIVQAAARIAAGSKERLKLGNIEVERDWGWAPEYVNAMWRMTSGSQPDDFIIATGRTVSLRYFAQQAFAQVGLSYEEYIDHDQALFRPTDIRCNRASAGKAKKQLGWQALVDVEGVVAQMVRAAQAPLR